MTEQYKLGYSAGWNARAQIIEKPTKSTIDSEKIIGAVCGFYQVDLVFLAKKSRRRNLVYPRQICVYFLRKYSTLSYKIIGAMLGGRDHTTAMHAYQTILNLQEVDEVVQGDLKILEKTISDMIAEGVVLEPAY